MLHYQPIVDLATGDDRRRRGARSLAASDARASLPPSEFIPLAEETGLHRRHRPLGARRGVPPRRPAGAQRSRRGSARGERQRVGEAGAPPGRSSTTSARRSPSSGLDPGADARDHRERARAASRGDDRASWTRSRRSASGSRSTTSGRATRHSRCSRTCPFTRSRSTARSCRASTPAPSGLRSCAPSSSSREALQLDRRRRRDRERGPCPRSASARLPTGPGLPLRAPAGARRAGAGAGGRRRDPPTRAGGAGAPHRFEGCDRQAPRGRVTTSTFNPMPKRPIHD